MKIAPDSGGQPSLTSAPDTQSTEFGELPRPGARERLVRTAYDLFAHRGIRAVGVDEVISKSGVAKATFYRHFPSKDDLVLAFLERREQLWTFGLIESEARKRGHTPEERLLAIFDVFDEWFRRDDFEACSFINVLLEVGSNTPIGRASIDCLDRIRAMVRVLADEAGLEDTENFARSWHILMKGSIVASTMGDQDAARRAQVMAGWLIDSYRPTHAGSNQVPVASPRSASAT